MISLPLLNYNRLHINPLQMVVHDEKNIDDTNLEMPPATSEELEEEMRIERQGKSPLIVLMIVSLITSATIGIRFYINLARTLEKDSQARLSILGEEKRIEELNSQYQPVKKLAYLKDNDISYYDLDRNREINLTAKGTASNAYTALAWKNKNELSIAKNENSKIIIDTFDISGENIIDTFEIEADSVVSIRWSHDGEMLAMLCEVGTNFILRLKHDTTIRDICTLPFISKEKLELNDSIYVRFSPNDEKILLQNTLASENQPSILILDTNGNELASIQKTENPPTFAFFMSNDTFYYKKDDYLYVNSISTGEETKLTDRIVGAFGFTASPDKSRIAYWTYDWGSGVPTIWTYEIGSSSIKRHKDSQSYPIWIDNDNLVSLTTSPCSKCYLKESFEHTAFINLNLTSKSSKELSEAVKVEFFSAENF